MEVSPHCCDSPNRILVCCAWHEKDISPQMRAKRNPPTSLSPLPVRIQAITRTTKAHRVHSWRLTIHAHCVALSEILHPSGQGAIFQGTVMSQWLCLELHTVSRMEKKKKKKGAISLAVIVMIWVGQKVRSHVPIPLYENIQTNFLVNKNNNKKCPDVVGRLEPPEDSWQPGEGRVLPCHRSQKAWSSFSLTELLTSDTWTFLLFSNPWLNYLVNSTLHKFYLGSYLAWPWNYVSKHCPW